MDFISPLKTSKKNLSISHSTVIFVPQISEIPETLGWESGFFFFFLKKKKLGKSDFSVINFFYNRRPLGRASRWIAEVLFTIPVLTALFEIGHSWPSRQPRTKPARRYTLQLKNWRRKMFDNKAVRPQQQTGLGTHWAAELQGSYQHWHPASQMGRPTSSRVTNKFAPSHCARKGQVRTPSSAGPRSLHRGAPWLSKCRCVRTNTGCSDLPLQTVSRAK